MKPYILAETLEAARVLSRLPLKMHSLRPTILIVDDDPAVCASLQFALALEGLNVRTAESGKALLAHPDLARAACLVLDYRMPGMDGFEVLKRLEDAGLKIPVILIAGPITESIREQAGRAPNIAGLLEKPLLDSRLRDRVLEIVG